ncbi:MAG: glycosyltransferase [Clostridia bacterium]|nr:glycosyltransferase [Clostridia bacterium]MDD4387204.1 glycosyltransferase [Clostridia bacterium]
MIFITLGTQKQSFKRLLDEIESCKILDNEEIIAQIGYTKFVSKKIKTIEFLETDEFNKYIQNSEFVITHGGVGSIFDALLKNKKIIAVPRLKKYNEHVDDHQIEICEKLASLGYIVNYNPDKYENQENMSDLEQEVNFLRSNIFEKYVEDTSYLPELNRCIEELLLN